MMARARAIEHSREPFGRALGELLRKQGFTDSMGNPNLHAFAAELDGAHYETLRKAVGGERVPTPAMMEVCADALGVDPSYFAEYRINQAHKKFDVREVGFEAALENFERWAQQAAASTSSVRGARKRNA